MWRLVVDGTAWGRITCEGKGRKRNGASAWTKLEKIHQLIASWCYNRMPKVAGRSGSEDKSCCVCLHDSFTVTSTTRGCGDQTRAVMTSSKCHTHTEKHTHAALQTPCVSVGKRYLILGDGLMTGHNMTTSLISKTVNDKTPFAKSIYNK